jgi:hypothetical protein
MTNQAGNQSATNSTYTAGHLRGLSLERLLRIACDEFDLELRFEGKEDIVTAILKAQLSHG